MSHRRVYNGTSIRLWVSFTGCRAPRAVDTEIHIPFLLQINHSGCDREIDKPFEKISIQNGRLLLHISHQTPARVLVPHPLIMPKDPPSFFF
jgi:hypothetical protein